MANILIIDDEASIRSVLRTLLESAGHAICEAAGGRAALDILEIFPNPFDIITLDIYMPHMNGFEFLSHLQNPLHHPPVLIVSAHSDQIPQAEAHKVSGRLTKPFGRQDLITKVNDLIQPAINLPLYEEKQNAKTNRL